MAPNANEDRALLLALCQNNDVDGLKTLKSRNLCPELWNSPLDEQERTALHICASLWHKESLKFLLHSGLVNVDVRDQCGESPLHAVVDTAHREEKEKMQSNHFIYSHS